jgi:hypothetical protein
MFECTQSNQFVKFYIWLAMEGNIVRAVQFAFILAVTTTSAFAEPKSLTGEEINHALGDQILEMADNAPTTQIFQKGGLTIYREGGQQSQGRWKVDGNKYCSQWPPSDYWACYDVLADGDLIVFVSSQGGRTEMRLVQPK